MVVMAFLGMVVDKSATNLTPKYTTQPFKKVKGSVYGGAVNSRGSFFYISNNLFSAKVPVSVMQGLHNQPALRG